MLSPILVQQLLPPLAGLPDLIPRKQLIDAQQTDTSLQPLFAEANIENGDITHGYVVRDGVLMHKCPLRSGPFGEHVWRMVVPSSLCEIVLTTAHDDAGHMGVKKTLLVLMVLL